jgi:hypothetical protein
LNAPPIVKKILRPGADILVSMMMKKIGPLMLLTIAMS